MTTTHIDDELAQLLGQSSEIARKIDALRNQKRDKIKADFKTALESALVLFKNYQAVGPSVWQEREFAKIAKEFHLQPLVLKADTVPTGEPAAPKASKPRSDVSKDDVFALIKETGKMTVGAVNKHFEGKASKVTVRNRLTELKNDGRIDEEPAGNKVFVFVKAA